MVASSWRLWQEHADPDGTMSREDFDAMTVEDRIALQEECNGPEPAPTVDDILSLTRIGANMHTWAADGGHIVVTEAELRPFLEEAYDPLMPTWPGMVTWDDDYGFVVA